MRPSAELQSEAGVELEGCRVVKKAAKNEGLTECLRGV